tara:strand:- start:142 stop:591 length:450 start_codon:yes stop_codon:yes gene_type:complete
MKCQKNHLFRLVVTVTFLFHINLSFAGERDELYQLGNKAFAEKDYVTSLKSLYAYYLFNQEAIESKPEFKSKILNRISTVESILNLSFAANPSVLTNDNRIRIITRTEGGPFIGNGKEIDDLLKSNKVNLEAIKNINHKALTSPSKRTP